MKHIFKKLRKGHNQEPNRTNETPPSSPSCATDHQRTMSGNSPTSPSRSSPAPVTVPTSSGNTTAASTVSANNSTDYMLSEEEFQVQLALAISELNSEDPEKDQIHAATLLSLGGHHQRRRCLLRIYRDIIGSTVCLMMKTKWLMVSMTCMGLPQIQHSKENCHLLQILRQILGIMALKL